MTIRSAKPADIPDIVRLNDVCGFPQRSEAGWDWVLFQNPHQGDEPPGYVYEKDGRVVAFLGAAAQAIHSNGRKLKIANGHTFISDLGSPGIAVRLVRHFFKHSKSDGGYTLNNNALSAPIYKKCGMEAIWEERSRTIADKRLRRFTHIQSAVMRKLAQKESVHRLISKREWYLTRPANGMVTCLEGVRPLDPFDSNDAIALNAFDKTLADSENIYGVRDAQSIQYRLQDPDGNGDAKVFVTEDADGIAGLLITRLSKDTAFGVVTLEIEDLILRPDSSASMDLLVRQAEIVAKHQKAARILWRIIPFSDRMSVATNCGFALRKISYDSCHVRPMSDWSPEKWALTGFDGDFWFALRKPPR